MKKRKIELMLDSGAFAAWTRRVSISVSDYIRFVKEHEDCLFAYVNLDVMPGQPGKNRTQSQVEESAEQGWKNLEQMRKAGLSPIHVFHQGERRYWLERMLGEGLDYIGLSANITLPTKRRMEWLDQQFRFLCGTKGYPGVKIHGFGITAVSLIHRYPWYTTDSSTWLLGSKTGSCQIPRVGINGEPDYQTKPWTVRFAETRRGVPHLNLDSGEHYRLLEGSKREYVDNFLKREGFDPKEVCAKYSVRCRINARFFLRCEAAHQMKPFRVPHHSLFGSDDSSSLARTTPIGPYHIILVNGTDRTFCGALLAEHAKYHLLSYFDIRNRGDVRPYVEKGIFQYKKVSKVVRVRLREWDLV